MSVATKAIVIPRPRPLLERSNVHQSPSDKAARVRDSWMLFAKSSFWKKMLRTVLFKSVDILLLKLNKGEFKLKVSPILCL